MQLKVVKTNALKGEITIPADKSISHRAVMLSSLAKGVSVIENFSKGADCLSTLEVVRSLGVEAEFKDEKALIINSKKKFVEPKDELYCGNSGTTMRLMAGILAGQNFNSVLTGDESLSKRPMGRIIEPLGLMGAVIEGTGNGEQGTVDRNQKIENLSPIHLLTYSPKITAPLKITGTKLHGIDYISKLASAQVKSCVLLAGLHASGKTSFTEPYPSRNHTELMLEYLGANIQVERPNSKNSSTVQLSDHATSTIIKPSILQSRNITVPGDISSAAFFIVAGLIVPKSEITLKNVGLNPTRTGILEVIEKMGGQMEILDEKTVSNEIVGDLRVKHSELKGCVIEGEIVPKLIDELPVIAVLATQAEGKTIVRDAQDLRNKESDRIKAIVTELKKLGANIEETEDGFIVTGKTKLKGGAGVETYRDHRLAMSLYAAGLICEEPILINGFEWANISFPEFEELIGRLT
ncbi:MAG: 3-phosphoshikimate 1-carboxyvinyltransferase [Candidatus Gastranaerophilaceae bacterium]